MTDLCNCITALLQNDIKSIVTSLRIMKEEVKEINKAYWSTDANTQVSGLSNDTDAASLATKLTKAEYTAGVTLCEELEDFFTNDAVTTSDYAQSCNKIHYGSHATGAELSAATEAIASRIYQVALDCLELFKKCKNTLETYTNNEVNDMIANLDSQRLVPGSNMTKDDLNSAITLVEQFKKLMNNEAVTTADYSATIAKWQRLL